jgi:hypothetical protein
MRVIAFDQSAFACSSLLDNFAAQSRVQLQIDAIARAKTRQ